MRNFVTGKQIGQLLLGWAAVMAALFLLELAEIGKLVPVQALGILLRPLFAIICGAWLAQRHARGVTQIDWRGVCIYMLACVILLLAFALYDKNLGLFWLSSRLERWFGIDSFDQMAFDYFNHGGIRWNARWISYWFLMLCYFDVWPWAALAAEVAVYPIAKIICIKRQQIRREIQTILSESTFAGGARAPSGGEEY
ncbi:MAG: hypothetical protein E7425_01450 [Ruminococcaceae bacterium]|nr:hypothetical protein [Oscillospiraceae bacterium]